MATVGDGSYLFANPVACHQVAEALDLPLLTIVLNNGMWNAVHKTTRMVYPDGHAARSNAMPLTSLAPAPDYALIARASRGHGERVEHPRPCPAPWPERSTWSAGNGAKRCSTSSSPRPDRACAPAERLLTAVSKTFFLVTALALFALAAGLVGVAVHDVWVALPGADLLPQILRCIGLLTIAVAVFEVAKFLLEEELIRERELRSITDVRLSLTKFFTIIIIVLSLEGIVLVFEVKLDHIEQLIYPTALMGVGDSALWSASASSAG